MALAALLACAAGRRESRSGGLVVVERWLNHPVLLIGSALVLVAVSFFVELGFSSETGQIGCGLGLAALGFGLPIAVLMYLFGPHEGSSHREAAPGRPDRVITITEMGGFDPLYRRELVSGSGWSARHWELDYSRHGTGVNWSGPDRITITRGKTLAVFDVLPDGSLSEPWEEPLPPKP
ncbi:hypothetical protein ACFU7Y_12690 [Kitasatospora sp. NPDC057542]|uniref:hypothetical protein n=1 Tax=Streptomycetaceae TaxID=2062 RepID=UPI001CCCA7FF|nr:hypothetical protein [Streptomyces sp. LS1784]